jgi:hypothetical protein
MEVRRNGKVKRRMEQVGWMEWVGQMKQIGRTERMMEDGGQRMEIDHFWAMA